MTGDGAGRLGRLPDRENGAALQRPVSMGSTPGETDFQTVPQIQRRQPTLPDTAGGAMSLAGLVTTRTIVLVFCFSIC